MRYLALYNPTTKIAQNLENYLETDVSEDGMNLYSHNVRRFIAEAKNRGTPWASFDDSATFSSKNAGYSGDYITNSLVLIGDSRTEGWKTTQTNYFSSFATLANRGIGGDTAEHQSLAIPLWGLPKYEKAVISIGINDWAFEYTETVRVIDIIVSEMKKHAEKVFLTTIPSVNANLLNISSISVDDFNLIRGHALYTNQYIPQICKNQGINFIDLAALMNDGNGMLQTTYDDGSGIHYNEAGYAAIRQLYTTKGI